jgi:Protoglobin
MTLAKDTSTSSIPGYDYGTPRSAISPVSESELSELEQTAGWTSADADVLARYADLFRVKAESMVDSWRAVIGSQPHLAHRFVKPDGTPDDEYKASVKRRFVQWVVDVALRPHDRDWLNYQQEIGLRHTPTKKNKTDGAHTPPVVPFRYLLGFVPVVLPIRQFFAEDIKDEAELKRIEDAWTKAVLLHITLWSRPYLKKDLW